MAPADEKALDQYLSYAVDEKEILAAIEPARRAVAANSWSSIFHERLAYFLLKKVKTMRDRSASRRRHCGSIRFLRFARMFMVQSLIQQGEADRAAAEFATLIKLHERQREPLEIWYAEKRRH